MLPNDGDLGDSQGPDDGDLGWSLAFPNETMEAYALRNNLDVPLLESVHGKVREMAAETYVNRVKTSDKQQKAMTDFIQS